jgi:hypothetical protein
MATDVFTTWQASGFNAGSFPAAIQPVLQSQDTQLVAQTGHFDPNRAFITALVNAVNAALGG